MKNKNKIKEELVLVDELLNDANSDDEWEYWACEQDRLHSLLSTQLKGGEEKMKTLEDFNRILDEIQSISGLPAERAVDAALILTQESGKDRRSELLRLARADFNGNGSDNGNQIATEKQRSALAKFGIKFNANISKAEASDLLDKAITESNSKRKGRRVTAPSFFLK